MAPSSASEPPDVSNPGPHPSYIQIAKPYIFESKIQDCLLVAGVTETRDDNIRLQAVSWIDSVRRALHLPVRTFNTAVVYLHKFRLVHPDSSGFIDAAAAALFTACKIEDTLKKSRDILCAAHNLKLTASEQLTPDDPMFENHAKVIIGVERLMLEASAFDFRNRYPQRLLIKVAKIYGVDKHTVGKTAYNMSLDLYRTFAPLKQTTPTMAIACVQLAGRLLDNSVAELEAGKDYEKWKTTRQETMETLLDLLDLYTHHRSSTIVGQDHALEKFISIRIALNQEASAQNLARFARTEGKEAPTNGATSNGAKEKKDLKGLTSPRDTASPKDIKSPQPMGITSVTGTPVQGKPGLKDGTVRFMLDPERARDEKHAVAEFFKMDEEEYEVEVENDRRRDSAIDMTLPEEQASDDASHCMDVDLSLDDLVRESRDFVYVGQGNLAKAATKDSEGVTQRATLSRKTNGPLPDQKEAFHDALRQLPEATPSVREGTSDCTDQGNQAIVLVNGSHLGAQSAILSGNTNVPSAKENIALQKGLQLSTGHTPPFRGGSSHRGDQENCTKALRDTSSRKTNVPLADQTAAFKAALQQSTGAAPNTRRCRDDRQAENDLELTAERQARVRKKNSAKKQTRQKKRERQQREREQQEGSVG